MAYLLWLVAGWLGAHRFYLREPLWGLIYFVTGGLFMLGWFVDAIFLGDKVDEYNRRIAEDNRLARARLVRGGAVDKRRKVGE
ncbi:MAG: TM2 domain-containing protein [Proteobacteria bacterium]|nr:TM2 domain-containing protein [Pseudomonadota bacterium]